MNALKSGIHAKSLILPSEKLADLEQLIERLLPAPRPGHPGSPLLLDEVIHCEWLLRRYRAAEAQMWQHDLENLYGEKPEHPLGKCAISRSTPFSKLQYRVDATRRAYQRPSRPSRNSKPKPPPHLAPALEPPTRHP